MPFFPFFSVQGVVQQTVKDMNQSLIDDFLVFSDKIGSANFFWSFPSKAYQDQCVRRDGQQAHLVSIANAVDMHKQNISFERTARSGSTRAKSLEELAALRAEEKQLDGQLEQLKVNDPDEIRRVEKLAMGNKAAADRWTDNIWQIKSYLTKRKGMSGKEVSFAVHRMRYGFDHHQDQYLCLIIHFDITVFFRQTSYFASIVSLITQSFTLPVPPRRRDEWVTERKRREAMNVRDRLYILMCICVCSVLNVCIKNGSSGMNGEITLMLTYSS